MTKRERVLEPAALPPALWSKKILRLAPILVAAYRLNLAQRGLLELAAKRAPDASPVGGHSLERTLEHFAEAFDGSAARTQLALLDPNDDLGEVSDMLAVSCTGGELVLLDLPCGAGAFALSLLCTIAELRASLVLPREPLDVIVVGGDISAHARDIANDMFAACKDDLERQAIHVTFTPLHWDACDQTSTTALNQRFVADADKRERKLVAMSNLTGFLVKESKMKAAESQISEIFRYASGGRWSVAIWLEPQLKAATDHLFPWVDRILAKIPRFLRRAEPPEKRLRRAAAAHFEPPLQRGGKASVRLTIDRFDLGKDEQ